MLTGKHLNVRAQPLATARRTLNVTCSSAGGFGKSNKKRVETNNAEVASIVSKLQQERGLAETVLPVSQTAVVARSTGTVAPEGQPSAAAAALGVDLKKGWKDCGVLTQLFATKPGKVVELAAGKAIMLYSYKGKVYCTDAYSTAYQYPLFDAKVSDNKEGKPVVEVPLDGTVYNLETGKVELWCPKDGNLIRNMLGALKRVADPIDLKVYRTVVADGRVYVRVYDGEW